MTALDGTDLRFDFAALPERVWEAMTNPAKAAGWLPDGMVAEVGRRLVLSGQLSGEVIAVDPTRRVDFRLRHSDGTAAAMTWLVQPAAGGATVTVVVTPAAAASDEVRSALRVLFDDRLRVVLRVRAPMVVAPAPPDSGSPGPERGPGRAPEPVRDGPSQAVSLWPALRQRRGSPPRRRTGGVSLALRLVAVAAVAAVLGAITFGPPSIPWAAQPDESNLDDSHVAAATADPTAQPAAGVTVAPGVVTGGATGGATVPTTSSSLISGGPPTQAPVPLPVPPLEVSLTVSDRLLKLTALVGYTVNVSITNPAGVGQTWQNVSVHLRPFLDVTLIGSSVVLDLSGPDVCATPAGSATIAAGQTLQFSIKVAGVSLVEPTTALLNQPSCG